MRAKRSKDMPLVDKFSKKRKELCAESKLQRSVSSTSAADYEMMHSGGEEENDLKVMNFCLKDWYQNPGAFFWNIF